MLGATDTYDAITKTNKTYVTNDNYAAELYCTNDTLKYTARIADSTQCTDLDACITDKSCIRLTYPQDTSVDKPKTYDTFLNAGTAYDPTADDNNCPTDTTCDKTSKTYDTIDTIDNTYPKIGCHNRLYYNEHSTYQPLITYNNDCTPNNASTNDDCHYNTYDKNARACLTYYP